MRNSLPASTTRAAHGPPSSLSLDVTGATSGTPWSALYYPDAGEGSAVRVSPTSWPASSPSRGTPPSDPPEDPDDQHLRSARRAKKSVRLFATAHLMVYMPTLTFSQEQWDR